MSDIEKDDMLLLSSGRSDNWNKNLLCLKDFTFMQLYHYLVNSRDKTFNHESLKVYKYFDDQLIRNV